MTINEKINELQTQLMQFEQSAANLREELSGMLAQAAEAEARKADAEAQIAEAEARKAEAEKVLAQATALLASIKTEVAAEGIKVEKLKAESNNLQAEVAEFESKKAQLASEEIRDEKPGLNPNFPLHDEEEDEPKANDKVYYPSATESQKTVDTIEEQCTISHASGTLAPHVEDIRRAISIGDRFLFQKELFAGNGELFNQTIDALNKLSSLDEAMDYVNSRFNWDKESQAYELFVNILKRRW